MGQGASPRPLASEPGLPWDTRIPRLVALEMGINRESFHWF